MTDAWKRLVGIQVRHREATPGPWFVGMVWSKCSLDHGKGSGGHGGKDCVYREYSRDTVYVAEGTSIYAESGACVLGSSPDGATMSEPDARFAAAAWEDVRFLLALVAEQDAEITRLKGQTQTLGMHCEFGEEAS